jgi:Fe-S-cluster containining protein
MQTTKLSVITSCDNCGACCQVVTSPPFYHVFEDEGEEAWDRMKRVRPDLLAGLLAAEKERRQSGAPDYGTPCLWFDTETLRCRHYDYRPLACRLFEVNSEDCHDARRRAGIG